MKHAGDDDEADDDAPAAPAAPAGDVEDDEESDDYDYTKDPVILNRPQEGYNGTMEMQKDALALMGERASIEIPIY